MGYRRPERLRYPNVGFVNGAQRASAAMREYARLPKDRAYKLFDTQGLYLKVSTSGARLWRFKYSLHGRERPWANTRMCPVAVPERRGTRRGAWSPMASTPLCSGSLRRTPRRTPSR